MQCELGDDQKGGWLYLRLSIKSAKFRENEMEAARKLEEEAKKKDSQKESAAARKAAKKKKQMAFVFLVFDLNST